MRKAQFIADFSRDLGGMGSYPSLVHLYLSHPVSFGALNKPTTGTDGKVNSSQEKEPVMMI